MNSYLKKTLIGLSSAFFLSSAILLVGCDKGIKNKDESTQQQQQPMPSNQLEGAASLSGKGTVVSTGEAGNYSILELENNGKKFWIATTKINVKAGDKIKFQNGELMTGFYSQTLKKTFDEIIFTNFVSANGKILNVTNPYDNNDGANHKKQAAVAQEPIKKGSVAKATDGYTVAELYNQKGILNGKSIKVRGKVVKYLSGIMGKNWIHIQDGSGQAGTNDLTITTMAEAKQGDTVLCTGKLVADKDFGQGYQYALILEDAAIVVEK